MICNYFLDYRVLGDPCYGVVKKYQAQYKCKKDSGIKMIQLGHDYHDAAGNTVQMSCYGESYYNTKIRLTFDNLHTWRQ